MAIEHGPDHFHWADYVVFAIVLGISTAVGIFFGFCEKKQANTEDFLMAGRSMSILPVAVSMFVSCMSAIAFLGEPVEVYIFGAGYWWMSLGYAIGLPIVAHWFAPAYHAMRLTSAYEFLESKYNRGIRLLGSIVNAFTTILWMAIVLYAPSLAMSQASGMSLWATIISIGVVCTFYTTVGGMKAVIWADTIQMFIMLMGLLAVIIKGTIQVGGVGRVWQLASEGGRLNFGVMNPNPYLRSSFWVYTLGGLFRGLLPFIATQFCVQRYCTLKTPRDARIAVYVNIPFFVLNSTFLAAIGLVMYASYHDCDPFLSGRVKSPDQMVPLLVLDLLGFLPGVSGLFMACVFSASLSTLSSGLNGLSATFLKDMIFPWYEKKHGIAMGETRATWLAKGIVVVTGALVTVLAFLILALGSSIFEMTAKVAGVFGSPLCAAFILGIFYPKIRTMGMMVGFVVSLLTLLWLAIGAIVHKPRYPFLPLSVENCQVPTVVMTNISDFTMTSAMAEPSTLEDIVMTTGSLLSDSLTTVASTVAKATSSFNIYSWNPVMYIPLGTIVACVVGVLADYLLDRFGYYKYRAGDLMDTFGNNEYKSGDSPSSIEEKAEKAKPGWESDFYPDDSKPLKISPNGVQFQHGLPSEGYQEKEPSKRNSWFSRIHEKLRDMSPLEWYSIKESVV